MAWKILDIFPAKLPEDGAVSVDEDVDLTLGAVRSTADLRDTLSSGSVHDLAASQSKVRQHLSSLASYTYSISIVEFLSSQAHHLKKLMDG